MAKFQKWKVLSGSHGIGSRIYSKGQTFITDADMSKFNTIPQAPKYKLLGDATEAEILQSQAEKGFSGGTEAPINVDDPTAGADPSDSLEAMTLAELKALAIDESINLTGISKKEAIVAKIREARAE